MYKVPFLRFQSPPHIVAEELAALERALTSQRIILGADVENFEKEFAAFLGVESCVGVANGMDALEICLRALGVAGNDEVIVPAVSAYATLLAVVRAGATPVVADTDPRSGHMDIASVQRCLSKHTKVILPVHLFGALSHASYWRSFCNEQKLLYVEDCAQAHGASYQGCFAGGFGQCGAYSFYPTKNLGASGDGGCVVTNDPEIAAKSRILRNYGQTDRYHHEIIGLNSRLDEMQAALLRVRLPRLESENRRRCAIAAEYREAFQSLTSIQVALPAPEPQETQASHLFVVCSKRRDRLKEALAEKGIETLMHYPVPFHLQRALPDVKRDPNGLGGSEQFTASCLSLPCHPRMTDEEVRIVIDGVVSCADAVS